MSLLLSKIWGYLVGAGALVAAIFAAWGIAKRQGRKEEQAVETERSLKESREANAIDDKVHSMSDAELDRQLQSVRPPEKK
jgi:hypothetical protein